MFQLTWNMDGDTTIKEEEEMEDDQYQTIMHGIMAAYQHYRSQFGDTTFTKVFVGGLAWETPTQEMHRYFEQFGEILEAVIITDKTTGRSKGYGFVTFHDPESARRSCIDPNPMIDGRRANCNIASFGRPRPSPPRGRTQGGTPYQGARALGATPYSRVGGPLLPPPLSPPPVPPQLVYPPYGYTTYTTDYGYPQTLYNPNLQPQYYYGGGSTSMVGSPYYYGYSLQSPRGTYVPQAHGIRGPSYMHYPAQGEGSYTTFTQQAGPQPTRHQTFPLSTTDSQISDQTSAGVTASESPNT